MSAFLVVELYCLNIALARLRLRIAGSAGGVLRKPAQAVAHDGRFAELGQQAVVGHGAHGRPDHGHQLGQLGQVDVVAVLLLERCASRRFRP